MGGIRTSIFNLSYFMYLDILCVLTQSFKSEQLKTMTIANIISNCHMFLRSPHAFVLESTKNFYLQYSLRYLRTFERVVIMLGLFRSSLFIVCL